MRPKTILSISIFCFLLTLTPFFLGSVESSDRSEELLRRYFENEPALLKIHIPADRKDRPETFVAALDKKFKAAIKMLAKHNPQGLDAFTDPDDFEKIINAEKI